MGDDAGDGSGGAARALNNFVTSTWRRFRPFSKPSAAARGGRAGAEQKYEEGEEEAGARFASSRPPRRRDSTKDDDGAAWRRESTRSPTVDTADVYEQGNNKNTESGKLASRRPATTKGVPYSVQNTDIPAHQQAELVDDKNRRLRQRRSRQQRRSSAPQWPMPSASRSTRRHATTLEPPPPDPASGVQPSTAAAGRVPRFVMTRRQNVEEHATEHGASAPAPQPWWQPVTKGVRQAVSFVVWVVMCLVRAVVVRFAWLTTGSLSGTRTVLTGTVELAADVCDVCQQIFTHWVSKGLRRSARSTHRNKLLEKLDNAQSYEEWRDTARQLDRIAGNVTWKMGFESTLYDYMLLRDHLDAFYQARKKDNRRRMAWLLRTTLHRNLAGMGNPRLFERCYEGTKDLIEQYVDEVVYQINYLTETNVPGMSHEDKLQMFEAMRSAFGCSALLLSGGGGFGIYHLGVVRVLHQEGLLPRIISGSSAGSLMASLICTRTDEELDEFFADQVPSVKSWSLLVNEGEEVSFADLLKRLIRTGSMADVRVLETCIYDNIGAITFEEAYKRTGRVLNITINARDSGESPRLLNHLTAPNVIIASAACASCALMGLFDTVEIKAEDKHGRHVSWNPGGQVWSDGSMETDLPMEQLAEHFNVNHFIVSQVNPHILPFLRYRAFWNSRILQLARSEMLYRLEQLLNLGFKPHWIKNLRHLLSQPYSGDITVTPRVCMDDYVHLVSNPTPERVRHGVQLGQVATWPKMSILQNHCKIELALDAAVHRLNTGSYL